MRAYLKKSRNSRNLTQQEIANSLGISLSYYCLIESGERQKDMNLLMASKLSKVLNVPLESIVQEEEKLTQMSA